MLKEQLLYREGGKDYPFCATQVFRNPDGGIRLSGFVDIPGQPRQKRRMRSQLLYTNAPREGCVHAAKLDTQGVPGILKARKPHPA